MAMDISKSIFNGGSQGFRVSVPLPIAGMTVVQQADPAVTDQLDRLDKLLQKRVLRAPPLKQGNFGEKAPAPAGGQPQESDKRLDAVVDEVLARLLAPRHANGSWAKDSLCDRLDGTQEDAAALTLSDWVDRSPDLLALRYSFQQSFDASQFDVREDVRLVLSGRPAVVDYLIAYAVRVVKVKDAAVVVNFVLANTLGAARVCAYSAVSAARAIVDQEQRNVPSIENDDSPVVDDIVAARLPLSAARFRSALTPVLDRRVFDTTYEKLIEDAGFGDLAAGLKASIIEQMKAWQTPKLDASNVKVLLPFFLTQAQGQAAMSEPAPAPATPDEDSDYDSELFAEDDTDTVRISAAAVRCASDLYGAMVLGEELEVFGAAEYFTKNYLLRQAMDVKDPALREDLQRYVFSSRFKDPDTHEIVDCTRPQERLMFERQVFAQGSAQVADGVIVNTEFPRLWRLLMLESANYLERARESYDPDAYVSRENVVQAVEDLQYNLSQHTTGLVQVVTPLIRAELIFLKQRIFEHPEVIAQVLPSGGGWLQVIEAMTADGKRVHPRATALAKKARYGSAILRAIARYVPGAFENSKRFGQFIGTVNAFITAQSILQQAAAEEGGDGTTGASAGAPRLAPPGDDASLPGAARPQAPAPAGSSEWDF
jgi:hypothetical protein